VTLQTVLFNKLICLTSYIYGTDLYNLYTYVPERTIAMSHKSNVMRHFKAHTIKLLSGFNIKSTSVKNSLLRTSTAPQNLRDIAAMERYPSLLKKRLIYVWRSTAKNMQKWNKMFMLLCGVSSWQGNDKWWLVSSSYRACANECDLFHNLKLNGNVCVSIWKQNLIYIAFRLRLISLDIVYLI